MLLKKLGKITITELKINLLPRIILCIFTILFTKKFYGFSNLNEIESLLPLERFIPLIGLIFIVPILEPELDFNIYQVVKTKRTFLTLVYIIRLVIALMIYSLLIIGILYYMKKNGSMINYTSYFYETLSIGIFLGSIGFILIGVTQNKIYASIGSLSYYLMNWFVDYEKLGAFYLFRLSKGLAPLNEIKLILAAMFIIVGFIMYLRRKT